MDPNRLRLAMVGGSTDSGVGDYHRRAIERDGGIDVVAGVFSTDPHRNATTADRIGVDAERVHDDLTTLLDEETARSDGAQVATILTPNHLHAPQVEACLRSGLHVICEKPLTLTYDEAATLVALADDRELLLAVTHTYTGYEAVRRMRSLIADGAIGEVAVVQVEYPQSWLATAAERAGNAQAVWRTDPSKAGSGCLGDIGTHAFNLAEFVTRLHVTGVACDMTTVVEGRQVDDNVHALLRFDNGASGMLWASQVAHGHENDLRIRVIGRVGTLEWSTTDALHAAICTASGETRSIVATETIAALRAAPEAPDPQGLAVDRLGPYVAAFATLYHDAAEYIRAQAAGRPTPERALDLQRGADGARAVAFVDACIESSKHNASWVPLAAPISSPLW